MLESMTNVIIGFFLGLVVNQLFQLLGRNRRLQDRGDSQSFIRSKDFGDMIELVNAVDRGFVPLSRVDPSERATVEEILTRRVAWLMQNGNGPET